MARAAKKGGGRQEAARAGNLAGRFGAAVGLASESKRPAVVSTGSLMLDEALGGGLPMGRIVEVYGPPMGGKSTLCLHAIADAQAQGFTCGLVDLERSFDPDYARALGVNLEALLLAKPETAEEGCAIAEAMVRQGVRLVAVDSVAAMVPKAEVEGEIGDQHVGLQARLMGQVLRKLTPAADRAGALVLFVNQLRMKVGVMYGNPETTPGGNALRHFASIRIDLRPGEKLKEGDQVYGGVSKAKVTKNKLAIPHREVLVTILFGRGFDRASEVLDKALAVGVMTQRGAHFYYGETKAEQGRPKARAWVAAHLAEIEAALVTGEVPS